MLYAVMRHCPMLGGAPGAGRRRRGAGAAGRRARRAAPALRRLDRRRWRWSAAPTGMRAQGAQALRGRMAARRRPARSTRARSRAARAHARDAAAARRRLRVPSARRRRGALTGAPRQRSRPCTARRTSRTRRWSRSTAPRRSATAGSRCGRRPRCRAWRARSRRAVAGVDDGRGDVHVTLLGGGFGRRLEVDVVGQAVRVALRDRRRPVQLIWPREEDIGARLLPAGRRGRAAAPRSTRRACRRPAHHQRRRRDHAALDRAQPAGAGRPGRPARQDRRRRACSTCRTTLPHQRIAHVATRSGVPVGFWRSVGHSHHAFFSECFIDELAHAAGRDPVAFRLALLEDAPRHRAVLQLAAAGGAGWGTRRCRPGAARGVALHESFGSIVAQVVEVSLANGAAARAPRRLRGRLGTRGQPGHRRAADGRRASCSA